MRQISIVLNRVVFALITISYFLFVGFFAIVNAIPLLEGSIVGSRSLLLIWVVLLNFNCSNEPEGKAKLNDIVSVHCYIIISVLDS